ncbi:extracellular solute-binding protein [Mycetocola sp.]|uniref:extracellular solute-binding protein n=1 Tax=Mycetocola sp. TaxID=1871042 RepID=UPI003989AAD5
MNGRRIPAVLAAVAAASMLLVGCGTGTGTAASDDGLTAKIEAVTDDQLQGTNITMSRMFGDCEETTKGVTDTAEASSECEAIQILTNKFNAENEFGITVERLGGADWNSYYDAFNASIAGGEPANIANLHDYALSDYARRSQLVSFDPDAVGIDMSDATGQAQNSVSYDDETFAVPFDSHAILAHVNTDILSAAGYLDADGRPIMPANADELLAMGQAVKDTTGKALMSVGFANDDMAWRMFYSFVRQQGSDLIVDGEANVDTAEAKAAMGLLQELIDNGYVHTKADYSGSIDEWKNGDSAILVNGTWGVNEYASTATFGYTVTDFPTIMDEAGVWASSHMWVLPVQKDNDPVKYRASLEFAKFLYENTSVWSVATGHIAPRVSVVESTEYQNAPERANYTDTALSSIRFVPQVEKWTSIKQLIHKQLEEVWFNGKDLDSALSEAQQRVEQELK